MSQLNSFNDSWANRIIALCLPPYTTHFLQPLDVGLFSPLGNAYKKKLEKQIRLGIVHVDKPVFLDFLKMARDQAFTQDKIMSDWDLEGLYPLDPDLCSTRYFNTKIMRSKHLLHLSANQF